MFDLTRDGFSMLVMGFTGAEAMQWKVRYIAAFNALEAAVKKSLVQRLEQAEALGLIAPPQEKEKPFGAQLAQALIHQGAGPSFFAQLHIGWPPCAPPSP